MFHHFLLFFSCAWCLHLSIADEIAMALFKCIDPIVSLFHNFITLIMKCFACFFEDIQQVGSNYVNLKSAANSKLTGYKAVSWNFHFSNDRSNPLNGRPLMEISGWVLLFLWMDLGPLRTTLCARSSLWSSGGGRMIAQNMGTKIGLIEHIYFVIFCAGWMVEYLCMMIKCTIWSDITIPPL